MIEEKMNFKTIYRVIGLIVFLISLTVLYMTVQPSVSFWDCGEFIAAGYYLQVPHPPGAPFFLLLGRIFSLIPFAENIAFRVNMISVLSSALSVVLLYFIAVKLIENYKGKSPKNLVDALATYIAAAIGALSFSFSDTFWFSGVEAEVYAASTFFFALITYLMIIWNERADNKDNEKYILLIAYLIGLSTGIHLMSVLAIISVVMMIMFRKYVDDDEALKKSGFILLGHVAVVMIVAIGLWSSQTDSNPPTQEMYQAFDSKFKMIIAGISALIIGAFWKKLFNRNSIYMSLIIGGIALFVTYPGVVKHLPGLMNSIAGNNITMEFLFLIILAGLLAFGIYYTIKEKKHTLHLTFMSFVFILLGFTTYTQVIIRANQNPPMNENEPNDFTELVSYLNREQYGDFPTFKRRFASEPHQMGVYSNYSSDLDFWWRYHMNHMMTRYLLWNYGGRESWYQDAGPNIWPFNQVGNALGKVFNIRFAGEAKDSLFGIPFLLGLIGIYFHFRKDWKMASIFMVLFIFMGYLTAFYQNQQQPQPRERDYFYVGAFFVYSIWIAIGIRGLIDLVVEKIKSASLSKAAVYGILALGVVLVPVRMLQANYYTHNRANNWVPWDYSYNLLQSCAPNAILFTNGDNDTFPLWYLQDVEGVRRDVRIANLSLLNTTWYIRQLKNLEPYGAKKVAMRLSDVQIDQLRPIQWEPRDVTITVPPNFDKLSMNYSEQSSRILLEGLAPSAGFDEYEIKDSSVINQGFLTWRMNNTATYGGIKAVRVQDLMVKEIVEANNWQRPIYFAVTCSEDSKIGMADYLRMEGMALRFVPEKRTPGMEFINENILRKQVFEENPSYSKDYKPGFKFRGLNDPSIFFDDNHERLVQNYRNSYIRLALYYLNDGNQREKSIEALDEMDRKIPRSILKIDHRLLFDIGNLYHSAGAKEQYEIIAREVEVDAIKAMNENPTEVSSYYNPYRILLEIYENLGEFDKAVDVLTKLQDYYPNDQSIIMQIERFKAMKTQRDTTKK
jgi:hypothetical protein